MKLRRRIIYGAFLVLGIGAWGWLRPESTLRWIQRVSSVHFSRGMWDVSITGNHEFYVSVHAIFPVDAIQKFVKQYGFTATSDLERQLEDIELDGFQPRLATIPKDGNFVAHSARTKVHRWTYILDRKTGRIWRTVFFPDMAGDPPGIYGTNTRSRS